MTPLSTAKYSERFAPVRAGLFSFSPVDNPARPAPFFPISPTFSAPFSHLSTPPLIPLFLF